MQPGNRNIVPSIVVYGLPPIYQARNYDESLYKKLSKKDKIIIIIIIIIINNDNCIQGRNSRFFTISSLCRKPSPICALKWPKCNRVQIMCNTASAYRHVQHDVLHTKWYEGTAQLLSLAELKPHLFELYFID